MQVLAKEEENFNSLEHDENRVDIDQASLKFLDIARQLESFFLQKRFVLSALKPELIMKEVCIYFPYVHLLDMNFNSVYTHFTGNFRIESRTTEKRRIAQTSLRKNQRMAKYANRSPKLRQVSRSRRRAPESSTVR